MARLGMRGARKAKSGCDMGSGHLGHAVLSAGPEFKFETVADRKGICCRRENGLAAEAKAPLGMRQAVGCPMARCLYVQLHVLCTCTCGVAYT